jgi:hypothetical protein
MRFKADLLVLGALLFFGAPSPASAQQQSVYKCGSSRSVKYTDKPCSARIVSTDPAVVSVKPQDVRRKEHQRLIARSMRQKPGESAEQFETRRRRARLMPEDSAECARIEVRMPVEEASLKNPDKVEVVKAELSLAASKKRFSELRC